MFANQLPADVIDRAEAIIAEAKKFTCEDGDALYLFGGEVSPGKDGCQPGGSMCLTVGPTDDEDWSELQYAVSQYLLDAAR